MLIDIVIVIAIVMVMRRDRAPRLARHEQNDGEAKQHMHSFMVPPVPPTPGDGVGMSCRCLYGGVSVLLY